MFLLFKELSPRGMLQFIGYLDLKSLRKNYKRKEMSLFFVYMGINILFLIFCIKSIPRLKCINAQWSARP